MSSLIPDHTKANYAERVHAGETWVDLAEQFRRDNYLDLAEWADTMALAEPLEAPEPEVEPEPAKPAAKA